MRAMRALSKDCNTSGSTEHQIPDFNPDTLRSLTEQIASNLKSQGKGPILKDTAVRSKTKALNANKELGEHEIKISLSSSAARNGTTAKGNQKPTVALKPSQAKKRSQDGRIKERSYGTKGNNVGPSKHETSKPQSSKKKIKSDVDNNIGEIRALGGTKEDVDLIAGVMSGSEIEDEKAGPSKELGDGLEKEVLQLVRQLGVDRVSQKEVMAASESEEAEEMEDIRNPDLTTSVGRGHSSLVSREQRLFFRPSNGHADFVLT